MSVTPLNADAQARAKAARDEAISKARREGLDLGRDEGRKEGAAAFKEALEASAAQIAAAEERSRIEVRGAAFWRGALKGFMTGMLAGVVVVTAAMGIVWKSQENALQSGADVASEAQQRGLAIGALKAASGEGR